jgi:hypothetical protein
LEKLVGAGSGKSRLRVEGYGKDGVAEAGENSVAAVRSRRSTRCDGTQVTGSVVGVEDLPRWSRAERRGQCNKGTVLIKVNLFDFHLY